MEPRSGTRRKIKPRCIVNYNTSRRSAIDAYFCSVFSFFRTHNSVHSEEWSSLFFFDLCFDDHGSFVIFRSASVRPKHLFDQNFDHDYLFKLPLQGVGCPFICSGVYFTPCPVPSCPTYEPNSKDGEYPQPFRHIQYNRLYRLARFTRVAHRERRLVRPFVRSL